MKAEFINPFLSSTVDVFATMLDCELTRGELSLNPTFQPQHEITGIIGMTGKASGTVVVSFDSEVALSATEAMVGEKPESLDGDVISAVGELTNMIAGKAKADLSQFEMKLALPTVITGKDHMISLDSTAQAIAIPYSCKWGDLCVEVCIAETISA